MIEFIKILNTLIMSINSKIAKMAPPTAKNCVGRGGKKVSSAYFHDRTLTKLCACQNERGGY